MYQVRWATFASQGLKASMIEGHQRRRWRRFEVRAWSTQMQFEHLDLAKSFPFFEKNNSEVRHPKKVADQTAVRLFVSWKKMGDIALSLSLLAKLPSPMCPVIDTYRYAQLAALAKNTKAGCSTWGCASWCWMEVLWWFDDWNKSFWEKQIGIQKNTTLGTLIVKIYVHQPVEEKTSIQLTLHQLFKPVAALDIPIQAVALRTMSVSRSDGSRFCWFSGNLLAVHSANKEKTLKPMNLKPIFWYIYFGHSPSD